MKDDTGASGEVMADDDDDVIDYATEEPEPPEPDWPSLIAQLRGAEKWLWFNFSDAEGLGQDVAMVNGTERDISLYYDVIGLAADLLETEDAAVQANAFCERLAPIAAKLDRKDIPPDLSRDLQSVYDLSWSNVWRELRSLVRSHYRSACWRFRIWRCWLRNRVFGTPVWQPPAH